MLKSYVAQTMPAHEPALVNIALDPDDTPFAGVLPHGDVPAVIQHRFLLGVHRDHQLIVIELAKKMLVVEITVGVDQRCLMIGLLHHPQEGDE